MLKQVNGILSTADIADLIDEGTMFSSKRGYPWRARSADNIRIFGNQREHAIILSENGEEFQNITDDLRRISGKDRMLDEYLKSEGIYPHLLQVYSPERENPLSGGFFLVFDFFKTFWKQHLSVILIAYG